MISAEFTSETRMLELILLGVIAIGMSRIASSDNQSGLLWAGVTLALGIAAAMLSSLFFLRMLAAGLAAFLLYIGYKVAFNK
jgi:hypothetical protein